MKAKPFFSVVMPVFNAEPYLRQAIDSILGQTFADFEFIIVNDGSTDGSLKIIKSYRDSRIVLISRGNKKLVYSLNEGIGRSRADYIARMDADDISSPTRLEKQAAAVKANPQITVMGSAFNLIDDAGEIIKTFAYPSRDIDIKRHLYIGNPLAHGSVVISKDWIEQVNGYRDVGPAEDYDLWIRLLEKGAMFENIPEALYGWRLAPSGISTAAVAAQLDLVAQMSDELWAKKPLPRIGTAEILREWHRQQPKIDQQQQKQQRQAALQYARDQADLSVQALLHGEVWPAVQAGVAFGLMLPDNSRVMVEKSFSLAKAGKHHVGQVLRTAGLR